MHEPLLNRMPCLALNRGQRRWVGLSQVMIAAMPLSRASQLLHFLCGDGCGQRAGIALMVQKRGAKQKLLCVAQTQKRCHDGCVWAERRQPTGRMLSGTTLGTSNPPLSDALRFAQIRSSVEPTRLRDRTHERREDLLTFLDSAEA